MEETEIRGNLIALAYKHEANWELIMEDLKSKRLVSQEEINSVLSKTGMSVSFLDKDYPDRLKQAYKPPFAFFYEGDINVLTESKHLLCVLNDYTASLYATETIEKICCGLSEKCTFVIAFGTKKNNELIRYLLSKGSSIVAVLDRGIGVDKVEDKELYNELKATQLIISSYPNTVMNKTPDSVFECAKVQIGISKSILVGAITRNSQLNAAIAMGLQQNNDFYCIPFQAGSNYITNQLIHDGATLVESSEMLIYDANL